MEEVTKNRFSFIFENIKLRLGGVEMEGNICLKKFYLQSLVQHKTAVVVGQDTQ